ncbi:PREDICTED: uncharacterized protein LOC108766858 [Trachymyrmex cornetzi]|uniref:Uncharacterized protein n=1 Tax=Trachymyrmex cornetzi TaxID=471704 RepID=A0A151IXV0_9HYME|nr:PREDICTED: uncharacterized protein LOC108766858 [Trachymyrmex cornetzi]KYN13126.1 hypothetical protein ALC57_14684 [Trachymyrmex cornetzi]
MLKDKIFTKSATRFPKTFQFGQANAACRFCKKIFCCTKCRDRHVDKVHPNVNTDCPLCASQILPLRQCESTKLNLEDEKLLCHIVNKHLPLRCRLCGDLFASREDFKSVGACKWFERWNCLTSPSSHEYLEKKSKQCSISESDCNGSRFCTPPEIYRKTSTPMLLGQKAGFETLSVPEFSFKTPKTDSSSISQVASISKTQTSDTQLTQFFSCLLYSSNEETTPFKICKDEQFTRSNSGRRLNIMEVEQRKVANNATNVITANVNEVLSPVNMDLTPTEGGILQDSPVSDDVCEDVMKKVRFSDRYETAVEFGDLMESCVRTILNMSMEDDSHDTQKRATATEDTKDANNRMQTNSMENTITPKITNDNQAEDITRFLIQPPENFLNNSQIEIIQDNTTNIKKENKNPNVSNEVNNGWSIINQQDSNRVLMMVLMESNSGGLTTDLMPLISSGLQKLQEQLVSNRQSPLNTVESTKICRRSITTMKMSVESVESIENYSADNVANGQFALSSPVESSENSNNSGFLSSVAQAVKHALRNLSVPGLRVPKSIEATEVVQGREIVEKLSTSPKLSSGASSSQIRLGKRSRETTEMFLKEDPTAFPLDTRSPLAKRQRRWYKMIRGRLPINRMRNSRETTSPRGVSKETQVFSQGSLTVGDTVLPLPARACRSTDNVSYNKKEIDITKSNDK